VLTFRLRHRARVVFTVVQVSPRCRVAGSFSVVGHRGANRIRFRGRIHGRKLPPGTYRIAARTPGGRSVLYTTVLIRTSKPAPSQLASALQANACAAAELALARFAGSAVASVFGAGSGSGPSSSELVRNQGQSPSSGGTLGASRSRPDVGSFSLTSVSKTEKNMLAIAALAAALILLGLAALPQAAIPDARLTDVIVRHRAEVAIAGAAALAAAIVALTFG
jgi:hypothetical protein